jgi:DNA-binding LytR/AlgR family response regulator
MKALIIEDEPLNARKLSRLLDAQKIDVLASLPSIAGTRQWLDNNTWPDIFFMDIELADGLAFEIFDTHTITKPIIFTTAYNQYALEAFKHHSIDYLLKPISEEKLQSALEKYKNLSSSMAQEIDLKVIGNMIRQQLGKDYKTRFSLKVGQHLRWINLKDIICFYSENKATYVFSNSGRSYPLDYTLDQLESDLNPDLFFRVNRKYLIHLNAIKDILRLSSNKWKVILNNFEKEDVLVSRDRMKDFRKWLG